MLLSESAHPVRSFRRCARTAYWKAGRQRHDIGIYSLLGPAGQPAAAAFSTQAFDADVWRLIGRYTPGASAVVEAPDELRRALWLRRQRQQVEGLGTTHTRAQTHHPRVVDPHGHEHRLP
jgi:hypothetical protein